MKAEIKALWIAALRSGAYKQGKSALHTPGDENEKDTYCCLGVLCDLAEKRGVVGKELKGAHWAYGDETGVLPHAVQLWAGLPNANPTIHGLSYDLNKRDFVPDPELEPGIEATRFSLAETNDDLSLSFEEIANIVEKYL